MIEIPTNNCTHEQRLIERLTERMVNVLAERGSTGLTWNEVSEDTAREIAKPFIAKGYYAYIDYRLGKFVMLHVSKTTMGDSSGRLISRHRVY